ncbi:MAG: TRAP transporter large permease [Treponema sp.]|jgi:C4-dicarboxylate transporter DctM subunit|nr:TRAP transporter large permease [Treponema sp.]
MKTIFFVIASVFLVIGLPIAFTIGFSSTIYILLSGITPQIIIQRLFTGVNNTALLAIPFFILAGELMNTGGIARRLVNLANMCVGDLHGSLAIVAIMGCMFFAAISGSGVATAAAIGTILLPEMEKNGYDKTFATSVIATASPIGVIIPPSISFIIYGVLTGTSITDLYLAGIPSGIIMGLLLIGYSYIVCKKKGYRGHAQKTSAKEKFAAFKDAIWALGTPLILLGGVFGGIFTPTESAVVAVVYSILVGVFIYREMSFKDILDTFFRSARMAAKIMIIISCATLFAYVLTYERIPQVIVESVSTLTDNKYIILIIVNVILLIAGTFMETGAILIIMVPLLMPLMNKIGIDPVHFGLIATVNTAIGLVTPPFGVCLFTAASVGKIPVEKLSKEVLLPIFVMIIGLIIVTFIPQAIMFMVN